MSSSNRRPVLAVLGFGAFAASVSLHGSVERLLVALAAAPLAAAIAVASLLPALYIASNLLALAPPLHQLLHAARGTLEDTGVLLLGFSPAVAFLLSSWGPQAVWLVSMPVLFLATRIGAGAFSRRFMPQEAGFATATLLRAGIAGWMCLVTMTSLTLLGRWLPGQ